MDHTRRSKPVWRSVIGPVSLGLLWPSVLGAFWFYILTEFGNPLAVEAVNLPVFSQQIVEEQSVPVSQSSFVRDDSVPSHARLTIAGVTVVDEPLMHLGHIQVNPDGSLLAFDLFPTGTETVSLGQIRIYDLASGSPVATMAGHAPVWNELSQLEFTTPDQMVATFDLSTGQQVVMSEQSSRETQEEFLLFSSPGIEGTFQPTSIRVRHHPQNYCRQGVAENEVVELPLEEYVARVLPAEVPPTWEMEALKAVAIAARTYAWNKIYQNLPGTYPYDVTDWANNQVMCDYRHKRSDMAVQATAGVIVQDVTDPGRLPILSMYSAENAHPTKKHSYLAYLDSVPDTNAIGLKRRGHGWGLSQLGAQRFAKQGLNYCQILGHYYSNIHITSTVSDAPLGCLIVNNAKGFATGSGLHIEAVVASHVSDLSVEIRDITPPSDPVLAAYIPPDDLLLQKQAVQSLSDSDLIVRAYVSPGVTVITDEADTATVPTDLEVSTLSQNGEDPTPTATPASDDSSNSRSTEPEPTPTTETETGSNAGNPLPVAESEEEPGIYPISLKMTSSAHTWFLPRETMSGTVLEIRLLTGTHLLDTAEIKIDYEGPKHLQASLFETDSRDHLLVEVTGANGDGFSMGRDWTWEQSSLKFTSETGAVAQDPFASDGLVWLGDSEQHESGVWFGPYTSVLPGGRSYRALFRLKMPDFTQSTLGTFGEALPVARLDVTQAEGAQILGFRELYVTDFLSATDFVPLGVDFHLFETVTDLEFRIHWYGTHSLALDQVTVVSYPFRNWQNTNFTWPVVPDTPIRNLRFAAFDEADNMSTLFTLNLNQGGSEVSTTGSGSECQPDGGCLYPSLDESHPSAIQ